MILQIFFYKQLSACLNELTLMLRMGPQRLSRFKRANVSLDESAWGWDKP